MSEPPQPGQPGPDPAGDHGSSPPPPPPPPPPGEANWAPPPPGWQPPGQGQYPPGQYGQHPGAPAPPKSRTGLWVGLGVGAFVLVALIVGSIIVAPTLVASIVNSDDRASSSSSSSVATPSSAFPSTELPGAVSIPTERAPMPRRSTPLPDPTSCTYTPDSQSSAPKPATRPPNGPVPATGTVGVTLKTTAGDIGLTLDRALAPCAVTSFIALAKQGFYNGTMCHRLSNAVGFQMLQCGDPGAVGDPSTDGQGGPAYTIQDEAFPEISYGRGVLAMAKTSAPDSGGSQFFMVYGEMPISPDYAVFGSITDGGLKVLDTVGRAGIIPGAAADGTGLPKIPVRFTGVTVAD